MRAVVQRVIKSSVTIDGVVTGSIGKGLNILLGVGPEDTIENAKQLVHKITHLRIFEDDAGKMNLSLLDIGGEALVISQFTLFADTRKGNRPSFIGAAAPDHASPLCDQFVELLKAAGIPTQTGRFGADMLVEIQNEGPVTIWLEF